MDSYCRQLVGWWATLKQRQSGASKILSPILRTGTFDRDWDERRPVAFGFVEQIAPFPPAWQHQARGVAARAIAYGVRKHAKAVNEESLRREFASVRRHVWKRFIKNHANCLNALLRMPHAERQCLDASNFCSVCVAYLAWLGRSALERHCVTGPRYRRASVRERIVPLYAGRDVDLPRFAELALFSFMRGWAAIERKIEYANLYVYHAEERCWPQDISRTLVDNVRGDAGGSAEQTVIILRADEKLLENRTHVRCASREALGRPMSNTNFYMNHLSFDWTRCKDDEAPWDPPRLFRIKDFSDKHSNSYLALYI
jgi:hypothetical protein